MNLSVDKYCFEGTPFQLEFPSVEPLIAKMDIERAFSHVWVDHAKTLKLGLWWSNAYFIDKYCVFGILQSSTEF